MGTKKTFKKQHGGWPPVIYVKREEDGSTHYFVCGDKAEDLPFALGETAELGTYTFAGHVKAEAMVRLGKDKV